MVWVLTDRPVRLMEAAPDAIVTGLPNAVPSTLNLTVPVGAAPLGEVTLTVNFTVVPEVKLAPDAGAVILNVGAGSVPVPDNSTVLLLVAVLSSSVRLAVRAPPADGLKITPIWQLCPAFRELPVVS